MWSLRTVVRWSIGLGVVLALPTEAPAKQCIHNAGGYVVRVEWFEPADVTIAGVEQNGTFYCPTLNGVPQCPDPRRSAQPHAFEIVDGRIRLVKAGGRPRGLLPDDPPLTFSIRRGRPVQTDVFPVYQGRCIDRPGGPHVALISAVGHSAAIDTADVFLRIFGGLFDLNSLVWGSDWEFVVLDEFWSPLPSNSDVFYADVPPTDRWLDAKGPVGAPYVERGADIGGDATRTGCHLWTDDFDAWCQREFGAGWGMKSRGGYLCPVGQGKANCAKGYAGGERIDASRKLTGCHLWTDDFDGWCKHEFGPAWRLDTSKADHGKGGYGCFLGQGKGVCRK